MTEPGAATGDGEQVAENTCPDCAGSGTVDDAACPRCGGTGTVDELVGDA